MIMKDGRAVVGYSLSLEETEKWDGPAFKDYIRRFKQALRELPKGMVIHRIDVYFNESYKLSPNIHHYFSHSNDNHFFERPQLKHLAYLFFSLGHQKQPDSNPINTIYSLGKAAFPNQFQDIEGRISQVEKYGEGFTQGVGMKTKLLKNGDLKNIVLQYLNLEFSKEPKNLHRQICPQKNGMVLGEKWVNIVDMIDQGNSVKHFSRYQEVENPFIAPLTHYLKIPHILSTMIKIEDTERELKKLDTEGKIIQSLLGLIGQSGIIKGEELGEFTDDIRRNSQKIVSTNVSIILWTYGEKEKQQAIQKAINAFQEMGGSRPFVESQDTTNLFFSMIPGNGAQQFRWIKMTGENACIYQHHTTLYKSDQQGISLCDRLGNRIRLDLFHDQLSNKNGIVIGPSGSGKSFTIGSIILQRYEQGAKQIIIDLGGSYENVMSALGGKYMKYDVEHPFSFNPFQVPILDNKHYLSEDKVIFITAVLASIWKKDSSLTKEEQAILSKLLSNYYLQLDLEDKPNLTTFYTWLTKNQNHIKIGDGITRNTSHFDMESLLLVLEPFAFGQYSSLLNSEDNIDISSHKIIAFDIAGIKDNPVLYPIISLLITELALDTIRKFPEQRKYLYMDEAWSMLSDTMGGFVERMYRTIRKNKGGIYIITQGISEILQSSVGAPILANADIKIVLNHSDHTQLGKIGSVLGLTAHELSKIQSMKKEKNRREVFIKTGNYGKVYFLEVSREISILLSSTPEERDKLKKIKIAKRGNIRLALDEFLQTVNQ